MAKTWFLSIEIVLFLRIGFWMKVRNAWRDCLSNYLPRRWIHCEGLNESLQSISIMISRKRLLSESFTHAYGSYCRCFMNSTSSGRRRLAAPDRHVPNLESPWAPGEDLQRRTEDAPSSEWKTVELESPTKGPGGDTSLSLIDEIELEPLEPQVARSADWDPLQSDSQGAPRCLVRRTRARRARNSSKLILPSPGKSDECGPLRSSRKQDEDESWPRPCRDHAGFLHIAQVHEHQMG